MNIVQVMNNNVCIASENGKEIVVIGTGIGFKKKPGDFIEETKIQKRFYLANNAIVQKMVSMMDDTAPEYFELVALLVEKAKRELGKDLNEGIYLTLADHISFSVERYQKGLNIKNGFLWDVKRLYPKEFQIGLFALAWLKERLEIELEEDEAAFIAIHIMNAEFNSGVDMMDNITKIIHEVVKLVQYYIHRELDEDSIVYFRFINHVKFFAQRIINHTPYEDKENVLVEIVRKNYRDAYDCALLIQQFVQAQYQQVLSNEEIVYLAIHIQRLMDS